MECGNIIECIRCNTNTQYPVTNEKPINKTPEQTLANNKPVSGESLDLVSYAGLAPSTSNFYPIKVSPCSSPNSSPAVYLCETDLGGVSIIIVTIILS